MVSRLPVRTSGLRAGRARAMFPGMIAEQIIATMQAISQKSLVFQCLEYIYPKHWNFHIFTGLIFPLSSPASLELALLVLRLAGLLSEKIISREIYGSYSVSGIFPDP